MKAEEFKRDILPMQRKLYSFASRILQNREEAEDVVQEVFVKLWQMKDEMERVRNREAFAMTMTRNLCLDKLKKKRVLSLDDDSNQYEGTSDSDPLKEIQVNDAFELVKHIVNQLPDQQRMIIQLRDIEGYTSEEVAEILDINQNTLRVNLSRARQKIRENLVKKYANGQEEHTETYRKVL
jgi:RNA polymerase sigma-70 factor (ECF subfamily)